MNVVITQSGQVSDVPVHLLLLADENPELINAYLFKSQIYLLHVNGQVRGVCLLTTNAGAGEIVNIAIDPDVQGRGLGKRLLRYVVEAAGRQSLGCLFIKTANSSVRQLALYQQVGFDLVAVNYNYFLDAYPTPVWENGIQAKHQLVFQLLLMPAAV